MVTVEEGEGKLNICRKTYAIIKVGTTRLLMSMRMESGVASGDFSSADLVRSIAGKKKQGSGSAPCVSSPSSGKGPANL